MSEHFVSDGIRLWWKAFIRKDVFVLIAVYALVSLRVKGTSSILTGIFVKI